MNEEIEMRDSYNVFHELLKNCYQGDLLSRELCKYYAGIIKDSENTLKDKNDSEFLSKMNDYISDHCQRYIFNNNKALAEIDISAPPNL